HLGAVRRIERREIGPPQTPPCLPASRPADGMRWSRAQLLAAEPRKRGPPDLRVGARVARGAKLDDGRHVRVDRVCANLDVGDRRAVFAYAEDVAGALLELLREAVEAVVHGLALGDEVANFLQLNELVAECRAFLDRKSTRLNSSHVKIS